MGIIYDSTHAFKLSRDKACCVCVANELRILVTLSAHEHRLSISEAVLVLIHEGLKKVNKLDGSPPPMASHFKHTPNHTIYTII
jgi:hypothetical protein